MLWVHFVDIMTDESFKMNFSVVAVEVRTFLIWVIIGDSQAAKNIQDIVKNTHDTLSEPFDKLMLARSPKLILKEIWLE